jgi:hypothetical protein
MHSFQKILDLVLILWLFNLACSTNPNNTTLQGKNVLTISWTKVTDNVGFEVWSGSSSVVYNNAIYTFIGGSIEYDYEGYPISDTRDVYSTSDGSVWKKMNSSNTILRNHPTTIVFNNQVWLIGGYNGWTSFPTVVTSDCSSWTAMTTPSTLYQRQYHASVVNKGAIYVSGGTGKYADNFQPWLHSTDGIIWDTINTMNIRNHTMLSYHDTLYVIGGEWGFTAQNYVLQSSNGKHWNNISVLGRNTFEARYGHTSVVYDDKMWVIGGTTEPNGSSGSTVDKNDCWYSSDGVNWTQANVISPFSPRAYHSSVVYDNKIWVIGGGENNDVWCGEIVTE